MARGPETIASENRLSATDKQRRALELRKAGVGYVKIAEELGYGGPSGAHNAVMTALQKTLREPADELRTMELERLDRMQAALWPQVQNGHLGAIDRVLWIMERRAHLLGLDAPKERRHTGADGGPIQHEHRDLSVFDDDELAALRALKRKQVAAEVVG
ncbi:MAG: hypothetical protein M3Q71_13145 [Chloroflexota bacterium]|nr:hypothetical protein [Chloroflexota bacterium]MDP9471590.1 hypothetical protein [Chloroflexota bacterium]